MREITLTVIAADFVEGIDLGSALKRQPGVFSVVSRTGRAGAVALPDHEDETDCPDPANCRAHDWVVKS